MIDKEIYNRILEILSQWMLEEYPLKIWEYHDESEK